MKNRGSFAGECEILRYCVAAVRAARARSGRNGANFDAVVQPKKQPFIRTAWPKGGRFTGCGAVLPFTPVAPLTLVCSHVLRHQIGMVGTMVRWCPPPYHTDETVKSRCNPEPFQQGTSSLFMHQLQTEPRRCSR